MKMTAALAALLPRPAIANCIPPWQTQLACKWLSVTPAPSFAAFAEPKNHLRLKEGFTPQSPPSQTAQKTLKSLASVPCLELKEKRQDECE